LVFVAIVKATLVLSHFQTVIRRDTSSSPEIKTGEKIGLAQAEDDDPAANTYVGPRNSPAFFAEFLISNPALFGFFQQGRRYRCTIEPL